MEVKLNQVERVCSAIIYTVLIIILFKIVNGNFGAVIGDVTEDYTIWFLSGLLLIVFGKYISETFFTKPSDALLNSITSIIALVGISNKETFFLNKIALMYSIFIMLITVSIILFKDTGNSKIKYFVDRGYEFVIRFGSSKVIFSITYLLAIFSYYGYKGEVLNYTYLIIFWVFLVFFDIVGWLIRVISDYFQFKLNKKIKEFGVAIGCENPLFYRIEVEQLEEDIEKQIKYGQLVSIETSQNVGSLGMIVDVKYLINKKWISVYLFNNDSGQIKINIRQNKMAMNVKSVFTKSNCAFLVDEQELDTNILSEIRENYLYSNKNNFVGYVTSGSDIGTINFLIIKDNQNVETFVSEGTILTTKIRGVETLYQVIDGRTKDEHLRDFSNHSFVVGIAKKIGVYDKKNKEFNTSKWLPEIYSPLSILNSDKKEEMELKKIATNSIGHLPQTDLEVPIKVIVN